MGEHRSAAVRHATPVEVRPVIDTELVRRLVATQFPHWAHLPVRPVEVDGWDNRRAIRMLSDRVDAALAAEVWSRALARAVAAGHCGRH